MCFSQTPSYCCCCCCCLMVRKLPVIPVTFSCSGAAYHHHSLVVFSLCACSFVLLLFVFVFSIYCSQNVSILLNDSINWASIKRRDVYQCHLIVRICSSCWFDATNIQGDIIQHFNFLHLPKQHITSLIRPYDDDDDFWWRIT